jgi:signal transduction histidine kinase
MPHRLRERLRALLVEDNPGDADLVREYLAECRNPPVDLEHATHVADAIVRLDRGGIDVVLLDLSLPDASGPEGLHRIRAAVPGVPVVVLSGAEEALAVEAMNAGAQDYLRKGAIDGELLRRAIRYAIQRHDFADRERLLREEHEARVAAEQAVDARDEFISTAAHEFRTPLATLQLQVSHVERRAQAWSDDPDCRTCARNLGAASRQVQRLERLVSTLLDVTLIADGRLAAQREEVDLAGIARRAADAFSAAAAAAGSSLAVDIPAPVLGMWDRGGIEQIVSSLLENAIKYGGGRPVDIAVRSDGDVAVLSIRDRGIGIAPENVARIFDRFARGVSVRHYGGLGLGLFICRHIAEGHGGTITVESTPGEGSTFTLRLPVAGTTESAAAQRSTH